MILKACTSIADVVTSFFSDALRALVFNVFSARLDEEGQLWNKATGTGVMASLLNWRLCGEASMVGNGLILAPLLGTIIALLFFTGFKFKRIFVFSIFYSLIGYYSFAYFTQYL